MAEDRAETTVADAKNGAVEAPDATAKQALLTCGEVARRLGVTRSTVIRHEKAGRLRATKGDGGVRYFTPDEVDALALKLGLAPKEPHPKIDEGTLAAQVFQRLEAGSTLTQLVIEFRQPPQALTELWRAWRLGFAGLERARIRREAWEREEREARILIENDKTRARERAIDERENARVDRQWEKVASTASKLGVAGVGAAGGGPKPG